MNFDSFNAAQLRTFGEVVKIKTASRMLILKAIVEADTHSDNVAQVQINHQSLLLYIDETELKNKGVERRQSVTVRGKNYTIVEIGDDMGGMAVIRVSRA